MGSDVRWSKLGTPPPAELRDARLQLHWAAQVVMATGDALLPAAADDSHTSMSWNDDVGGLVGRPLEPHEGIQAGLRFEDLSLVVVAGGDVAREQPLGGMTLAQAEEWMHDAVGAVSATPPAKPIRHRDYDMPEHGVATGERFALRGKGAFAELARWYANADALLRGYAAGTPGAGEVLCWPHHFDIAVLVSFGEGRESGAGLSPGDHYFEEPYWYVNAYPMREGAPFLDLKGGGEWYRGEWTGAILRGSRLVNVGAAAEQLAAAADYLASAREAAKALIGIE